MALNSLLVALQGFAPGFALSPIALAVQGLIELLQEEQRQVYGSGKKGRGIQAPRRHVEHTPQRDALTEDLVRQQWDLLETRLRVQAEDRQARELRQASPRTVEQTVPVGLDPLPEPPNDAVQAPPALDASRLQAEARRRDDEAAALVLLLQA